VFGSAAKLNIQISCPVLDGVYRRTDGESVFVHVPATSDEALQTLLHPIISRLISRPPAGGLRIEKQGLGYPVDCDAGSGKARTPRPRQAGACTYRLPVARWGSSSA